ARLGRPPGRAGRACRLPPADAAGGLPLPAAGGRLPAVAARRDRLRARPPGRLSRGGPMPTLDQLRPGQRGRIAALDGDRGLTQRLMEMGVLEGEEVELLGGAPRGAPVGVFVAASRLSLRRREAACVRLE